MVRNSELPPIGGFASVFARAIKDAVEERGLSGSEIGRRLGRAQSYASLRLNGRRAWDLYEVDAIADMLGVSTDEFPSSIRGFDSRRPLHGSHYGGGRFASPARTRHPLA